MVLSSVRTVVCSFGFFRSLAAVNKYPALRVWGVQVFFAGVQSARFQRILDSTESISSRDL